MTTNDGGRTARRHRQVGGVLVTAALVAFWLLLLRPTPLGGPAGYVIVTGRSMEPTLLTGDLVITQRQSAYAVGDIVAFTAEDGVVIHRIVGGDAERGYDVKGDNRADRDLWHPRPDHIIGRQWLRLPQAGTIVAVVRGPGILAALSAGLTFLVAFSWKGRSRRRPAADQAARP